MEQGIRYVGLDVHKDTIAAAVAEAGESEPRFVGTYRNTPKAWLKLVGKLGPRDRVRCCYEAGPTGYGLQRQLTGWGVACVVVAPSLIPTKPGERVKTDRRDALKLARLLRSGDLTPVWVPDAAHEALRDLTRAREAVKQDRHRVRQRLGKLLLRLGIGWPGGGRRWTRRYRGWLGELRLAQPLQQLVLEETVAVLDQADAQMVRLDSRLREVAESHEFGPLLRALQCLRGVGVVTAVTLVAELGDLTRFGSARALMGYVGVVPREASSGGRQRRGRITKTGNAHIRFVLVEAAWHYRHPPRVGPALRRRREGQPDAVVTIGATAEARLHRRYWRLINRGKLSQQAVVAVARELLGFIWAIGQTQAPPPAASELGVDQVA